MSESKKIKVGISIGDVNGIGPEVVLKALSDKRILEDITPVIYASSKVISYHKKAVKLNELQFERIKDANQAKKQRINVIDAWEEDVNIELGQSTPTGGKFAFASLEAVTKDLSQNKIDVLVTAPINKKNIQEAGFKFPGHTEYLADLSGADNPLMILVSDNLRVGLVTGHLPLQKVAESISLQAILEKLTIFNESLKKDFALVKPRIAVLSLNPHAGDNGAIGDEEQKIILPAIQKAKEQGMLAFGPYPADGFFGSDLFKKFDGILAMYHDQGLAPFKALSFNNGVNYTAGLPIVRTSPDHGTAYDIAGKGEANENSFRQAIYLACDIYKNRKFHKEINENPLKSSNLQQHGD
ncbi:MAG: 4-hydroxythreonine-4-phosphate dehydrogenase PdxA [Luteibaculaceae bacterium]